MSERKLDMEESYEGPKTLESLAEWKTNFKRGRSEESWNPLSIFYPEPSPLSWWAQKPSSDESDALDEIQGLERGFNYLNKWDTMGELPTNLRNHLWIKVAGI